MISGKAGTLVSVTGTSYAKVRKAQKLQKAVMSLKAAAQEVASFKAPTKGTRPWNHRGKLAKK